jgi:hypothetical protein
MNGKEKINDDSYVDSRVVPHADLEGARYTSAKEDGFYDPSLESRMTRLGLNLESLKRAPGTTA